MKHSNPIFFLFLLLCVSLAFPAMSAEKWKLPEHVHPVKWEKPFPLNQAAVDRFPVLKEKLGQATIVPGLSVIHGVVEEQGLKVHLFNLFTVQMQNYCGENGCPGLIFTENEKEEFIPVKTEESNIWMGYHVLSFPCHNNLAFILGTPSEKQSRWILLDDGSFGTDATGTVPELVECK